MSCVEQQRVPDQRSRRSRGTRRRQPGTIRPLASACPARCSSATVQARPARSGQAVLPEHQCGAEQARPRSMRSRPRRSSAAPPIFLLEGVERGQDRAEHADGDNEDADKPRLRMCRPAASPAGRGSSRKTRRSARRRTEGTRRAAAGAIGAREPFVERQQAELRAKADHATARRRRAARHRAASAPASAKSAKSKDCAGACQEQEGDEQRHRADFEQAEHEQHRPAGRPRDSLAQDHHRAAQAHDLPGNQEAAASCRPNTPSAPSRLLLRRTASPRCRAGRRASAAGQRGAGHQAEAHQPQAVRRQLEGRPARRRQRRRQVDSGAPLGSCQMAATDAASAAEPSKTRANAKPRPVSASDAAAIHSSKAAASRSFAKAASLHALRRAAEEHQQRLDDRRRIGRATGQIDIDGSTPSRPLPQA